MNRRMTGKAVAIVILAVGVGWLFDAIGVPAGWLLGALITGLFFGLNESGVLYDGWPLKLALSLVGANIGLLISRELFVTIGMYIVPLTVSLLLTLAVAFY